MEKISKVHILFLFLLFIGLKPINGSECIYNSKIKVAYKENDFINYYYYLTYELDKFASEKGIEFEISKYNKNENFDIIFGEFHELKKLHIEKIDYPKEITNFYLDNNIEINNNVLPLDLDALIIVHNENEESAKFIENIFSTRYPYRYTLALSYIYPQILDKLYIIFSQENKIEKNEIYYDRFKINFDNLLNNLNKSLLESNHEEILDSYNKNENVYTTFSDGVLMYQNFNFKKFQPFPSSLYKWSDQKGYFEKNLDPIPFSFFGFSAYLNNINQMGFICHLLKPESRKSLFINFNVSASPLSHVEVINYKNIDKDYLQFLKKKNENIYKNDLNLLLDEYILLKKGIANNDLSFKNLKDKDYLN